MAGIWVIHRDEQGMAASASIYVLPCAADWPEPRTHDLAEEVVANGCDEPLAFCRPCARQWHDEAEREARLRALPPQHRQWLEDRGIRDWPPTESR